MEYIDFAAIDWGIIGKLHPSTVHEFEACVPIAQLTSCTSLRIAIYTDGSFGGGSACGWAAVMLLQDCSSHKTCFIGATTGIVTDNETHPAYVGATECGASQAERQALLWAALWVLQLPGTSFLESLSTLTTPVRALLQVGTGSLGMTSCR